MKIGFLSACLPAMPLNQLAGWASEVGFDGLELAAWPRDTGRPYQAYHADPHTVKPDRVQRLVQGHDLTVSALAYYENPLHPESEVRSAARRQLLAVIDTASRMGVPLVGTFLGANPDWTPAENMAKGKLLFEEFVDYAGERGVRLMIENCPMFNWVKFGLPGNYAFSPELWDDLFDAIPEGLGLNLDPSHLVWLGIDPVRVATDYTDRIFHVHAKDTEILANERYRYGIAGEQLGDNPWNSGWWRYRIPGRGHVDWPGFLGALRAGGYHGFVSIELEDPDFEGSPANVQEGLKLGLDYLKTVLSTD